MAKIKVDMASHATEADAQAAMQSGGPGAIVQQVRDTNGKIVKIVIGLPDNASDAANAAILNNPGVATTQLYPVEIINANFDSYSLVTDFPAEFPAAAYYGTNNPYPVLGTGDLVLNNVVNQGVEIGGAGQRLRVGRFNVSMTDGNSINSANSFEWACNCTFNDQEGMDLLWTVTAGSTLIQFSSSSNFAGTRRIAVSSTNYGSTSSTNPALPLVGGRYTLGQDESGKLTFSLWNSDQSIGEQIELQLPAALAIQSISFRCDSLADMDDLVVTIKS